MNPVASRPVYANCRLTGRQDLSENAIVAAPAVAEKGSFNLRLEVASPGGHSSVPPPHTVSPVFDISHISSSEFVTRLEYWFSGCSDHLP